VNTAFRPTTIAPILKTAGIDHHALNVAFKQPLVQFKYLVPGQWQYDLDWITGPSAPKAPSKFLPKFLQPNKDEKSSFTFLSSDKRVMMSQVTKREFEDFADVAAKYFEVPLAS
jgi:hypothetical protein